jgi:hypothetical protein
MGGHQYLEARALLLASADCVYRTVKFSSLETLMNPVYADEK